MQNSILCFTLFLCFMANCVSATITGDIQQMCRRKTGVSLEKVQMYRPGEENPPEDILCYIKCNFEKGGFLDEAGRLDIEAMKQERFPEGTDEQRAKMYECLSTLLKISNCRGIIALQDCIVRNQN